MDAFNALFRPAESQLPPHPPITAPSPQTSTFFSRLPYEIRRQILEYALGEDQRLQIDLTVDHPNHAGGLRRRFWCKAAKLEHCGANPVVFDGFHARRSYTRGLLLKYRLSKGYLCHNVAPDEDPRMWWYWQFARGPWRDVYWKRHGPFPEKWPGDKGRCQLEMFGWLLSCRQAAEEWVDILLSTSTLFLSNELVVANIDGIFTPSQLASVTSLDVAWPLRAGWRNMWLGVRTLNRDHLKAFVDIMCRCFPSLRRLHVSLLVPSDPGGNSLELYTSADEIMGFFDPIPQQMPGLVECALAIPTCLHELMACEIAMQAVPGRRQDGSSHQVWRSETGEKRVVEVDLETFPAAPGRSEKGYWVLEGIQGA